MERNEQNGQNERNKQNEQNGKNERYKQNEPNERKERNKHSEQSKQIPFDIETIPDADYEAFKQSLPPKLKEEMEAIEQGEQLPELCSDISFKHIFNPDIHKERFNKFVRLFWPDIPDVTGSTGTEIAKSSVYSKKTILDVIGRLYNNGIASLEMQKTAQEFISTRVEVYASDLLVLQYSVNANEKKSDMDFTKVPDTYMLIIMKESPSMFAENPAILHRKKIITDTGIELSSPVKVVYIEADKCYNFFKVNGRYPAGLEEIGPWMSAISDVNAVRDRDALQNPDIRDICDELKQFGQSKEVLASMFKEKYAEAIRNTELKLAEEKGEKRGEQRGIAIGEQRGINIGEQQGEQKVFRLMKVLKKNNNQLWMHLDELSTEELDVLYKENSIE